MKNNNKNKELWDFILNGEKRISDEEAEEMQKIVKKSRKE